VGVIFRVNDCSLDILFARCHICNLTCEPNRIAYLLDLQRNDNIPIHYAPKIVVKKETIRAIRNGKADGK